MKPGPREVGDQALDLIDASLSDGVERSGVSSLSVDSRRDSTSSLATVDGVEDSTWPDIFLALVKSLYFPGEG